MKKSNPSTNTNKSIYHAIAQISIGLGIMIFAVFLFLNVILFSQGNLFIIWLGIAWLTMIVGIIKVWFGIIDITNYLQDKDNPNTEDIEQANNISKP